MTRTVKAKPPTTLTKILDFYRGEGIEVVGFSDDAKDKKTATVDREDETHY